MTKRKTKTPTNWLAATNYLQTSGAAHEPCTGRCAKEIKVDEGNVSSIAELLSPEKRSGEEGNCLRESE
jgi:hypothetical protein